MKQRQHYFILYSITLIVIGILLILYTVPNKLLYQGLIIIDSIYYFRWIFQ
jgi:hypothetical protein